MVDLEAGQGLVLGSRPDQRSRGRPASPVRPPAGAGGQAVEPQPGLAPDGYEPRHFKVDGDETRPSGCRLEPRLETLERRRAQIGEQDVGHERELEDVAL